MAEQANTTVAPAMTQAEILNALMGVIWESAALALDATFESDPQAVPGSNRVGDARAMAERLFPSVESDVNDGPEGDATATAVFLTFPDGSRAVTNTEGDEIEILD